MRYLVASIFLSTFLLMPARASATPHTNTPLKFLPRLLLSSSAFWAGSSNTTILCIVRFSWLSVFVGSIPRAVQVETFESYRGAKARTENSGTVGHNHDGTLSTDEKQSARIILYGHSWGASETLDLARKLKKTASTCC